MIINNKIAITALFLATLIVLPTDTFALGINLNGDSDVKVNSELKALLKEKIKNDDLRIDVSTKSSANINSNDRDDGDNNRRGNSDSKNNLEVKKDKQFWGWFKNFLRKEAKIENQLKITGEHALTATSTANILWKTNVGATGYVKFSTDKNLVASSTKVMEGASLDLSHKVVLSGLVPGTIYYYIVGSTDASGNVKELKMSHFKTKKIPEAENNLPRILFSGTFRVGTSSANVIWVTSEPTNAKVWVSTTSAVNTTVTPSAIDAGLSYFHNLSVSGLATSTKYFYVVGSVDASGNVILGGESSFETKSI